MWILFLAQEYSLIPRMVMTGLEPDTRHYNSSAQAIRPLYSFGRFSRGTSWFQCVSIKASLLFLYFIYSCNRIIHLCNEVGGYSVAAEDRLDGLIHREFYMSGHRISEFWKKSEAIQNDFFSLHGFNNLK